MCMAKRGSEAFQIRGNAINQQIPWILDQDVEMNFAEKELVEQPFLVPRALSYQIVCSPGDPGETRGLLAGRRSGLCNCQGARLRGMGPVNLTMAGSDPVRACPWL